MTREQEIHSEFEKQAGERSATRLIAVFDTEGMDDGGTPESVVHQFIGWFDEQVAEGNLSPHCA